MGVKWDPVHQLLQGRENRVRENEWEIRGERSIWAGKKRVRKESPGLRVSVCVYGV